MINEWSPYPDLLLAAWKMNEYIPAFLVEHLKQRSAVHEQVVTVLGYTFKKDTDDVRDSLAPKLVRYIDRELPQEIRLSDYHLPDPLPAEGRGTWKNWDALEACAGADCIFVATNHSGYDTVLRQVAETAPNTWIVDIWNVGGADKIFYQAFDLRTSASREGAEG